MLQNGWNLDLNTRVGSPSYTLGRLDRLSKADCSAGGRRIEAMAAAGLPGGFPGRRLEGTVVLVTGASSGIGLEFCLDLAKAGCKIVAVARRIERLTSLCEEINGSRQVSPVAVAVQLDVSARGSVIDASVQEAWDAFGRIDALVNNAGVRGGVSSPLDLSEEEWRNVFATNLTGLWLVSKSVCKRMRDANVKGSVVNISSIAGLNRGQLPGGAAYAASKVMALELGLY